MGRNLHHAPIEAAGEGVDLAQHLHLEGKGRGGHRIGIGIEAAVGGGRRGVGPAAAIGHRQARGGNGPFQRRLADFGAVGEAGGFAAHGAQAEALGGIVARGADAPVIEHQGFGAPSLEEQLAVIGPGGGLAQQLQRRVPVKQGFEGAKNRLVHEASCSGAERELRALP